MHLFKQSNQAIKLSFKCSHFCDILLCTTTPERWSHCGLGVVQYSGLSGLHVKMSLGKTGNTRKMTNEILLISVQQLLETQFIYFIYCTRFFSGVHFNWNFNDLFSHVNEGLLLRV